MTRIRTSKLFFLISICVMIGLRTTVIADQFDGFFDEPPFDAAENQTNYQSRQNFYEQEIYSYPTDTTLVEPYSEDAQLSMVIAQESDVFESAENSFSDISQSDVDLSIAKAELESQQQAYNAQVFWDVDVGFVHSKITDHSKSKSIYTNDTVLKTSVSLKKTLWDKALGYSVEASRQNINTARINQFGEHQALIESVALAYLDYLTAKDMEAIAARRTNLFSQLSRQIKQKIRRGFAAEIDVVEVEQKQQTANISLLGAQTNLHKTQINLSQLIDQNTQSIPNNHSFFQRKDDIMLLPVNRLINTALANNTDLQSLQSDQISLQRLIQAKRAGVSPKLNLVSSLSQTWTQGDPDQDAFDFSAGVNMKMPLYTGGRINNQIKQAKLELLRAERGSNKKRREIITQLNILSAEFSGALSSYQSLLRLRENQLRNIKLIKAAVPYGVRANHNVYSALDDQFQLENSLIKQYYDLLKIKVKVMKITGELDSKNLNQLRQLLFS